MADTLEYLIKNGKLKSAYLNIKVIKKISDSTFIIADSSKVLVLDTSNHPTHGKTLNEGLWYKLIKCTIGENGKVVTNKSFKPLKSQSSQKIGDISSKVHELEMKIRVSTSSNILSFDDIERMENNAKINQITFKVISKSKIISSKYGNYQICNLKDFTGKKTSLNVYSKFIDKLEPYCIFTVKNLRRGSLTKDGNMEMRLHTTNYTLIDEGSSDDVELFKTVRNGDATVEGKLIGYGDIVYYSSCQIHLTKLDASDYCKKCETSIPSAEKVNDFRTEIYIEVKSEEDDADVKDILIFKRAFQFSDSKNIEENIENLVNKSVIVDYNVDIDSRSIAVSLEIME